MCKTECDDQLLQHKNVKNCTHTKKVPRNDTQRLAKFPEKCHTVLYKKRGDGGSKEVFIVLKGVHKKTKQLKSVKCSKSKTLQDRKLKCSQLVYTMR